MKHIGWSVLCSLLLVSPLYAAESITAGGTRTFTNATLGLTVVATDIDLPAGRWDVAAISPGTVIEQGFVVPKAGPRESAAGRRMHEAAVQRQVEFTRWRLQGLFTPCRDYAVSHGGTGPSAFSDLDTTKYGPLLRGLDRSPWPADSGREVTGPFFFLVPAVTIPVSVGPRAPAGQTTPLVVELRPYVDDGKHWVLLSDGRTERRPIDPDLVRKHNLRITFVQARQVAPAPSKVPHVMLGLLRDRNATSAVVTLTERATGQRVDVRWNLAGAQLDASPLVGEWAQARARDWWTLVSQGDSPLLHVWAERIKTLYGSPGPSSPVGAGGRDAARTTDAFGILGGRAALRETLQMELLRPRATASPEQETIPLSTIRGVEVKSHPFEQMLAGMEGGRLPLADHVPADRFFVYFARPAAIFPALDKGGDFLFRTGSLFTKNAVDDDLTARYLRRLGLEETRARKFVASGEVTELALVTPDLFFIDGTDVTVLMRVRSPGRVSAVMALLGIADVKQDAITEKTLRSGRSAYWARQDDLVFVSTNRSELGAVLALGRQAGAGSLGRSAEFRYMLTQLALTKNTRAFAYLSDAFVRRLVGPAVKIAQLRRMRARAEMEMIVAGALLFILDGSKAKPELGTLIRLGYAPAPVVAGGYRLRDDLSVVSPRWGRPAEMEAIDAAAIANVTPSEADAYRVYVGEYSRYWRQYFDPIAVRLDDAPGGDLEISTFILPLVDSELYNQLRALVAPRESGAALRVPVVAPEPVLLLSVNLTDDAWVKISGGFKELFTHYTRIGPEVFDQFGPGLHVAIQDADPIIVLGNDDLLGALGGDSLTDNLMREGLPLLLSVLTRPCKIFVELRDEGATLDLLRRAATSGPRERLPDVIVDFRQVEGRDAWIYALSVPGILKIRFGIEVRNGYLVLSNIPWSQPVAMQAVETRALNGAELRIAPGAVQQGRPGLFATQSEQSQLAALKAMSVLYPLLLTTSATPQDAAARHAALFGPRPLHPGAGTWIWKDGQLESSVYGTATRARQPLYRPEKGDFGLFEGVTRLSVNLQFEADGLRAATRWSWKGK